MTSFQEDKDAYINTNIYSPISVLLIQNKTEESPTHEQVM